MTDQNIGGYKYDESYKISQVPHPEIFIFAMRKLPYSFMMNHFTPAFRTLLTGVAFLCIFTTSQAQVNPYNFPKVKPEDFSTRVYEKDTSAVAVVIGDNGESYFEYNDVKGFQLIFTRHLRMRILAKEGYDYATQSFRLYRSENNSESVSDPKGSTFNLVNGKVVETKLGSSNIFEEQISQNWMRTTYTMPNVKAGSIIDVRYKITSDYIWNLREWEFQSTIPVQWSEYTVTIPEYFVFSKLMHGSVPFAVSDFSTTPGSVSILSKERERVSYTVQTTFETTKINFTQNVYHFAAQNVPAIAEEPYSPAITNFISKVEFELQQYKFPGEPVKTYTTTWEDICEKLLLDQDFGVQLNRGRIVKEAAEAINAAATSPVEKMSMAHALVRSKMTWNGKNSLYPTTNLREAYDKGTGNSGDINLMLLLLLRELGLDASPVALSTRSNGILVESHPVSTQLNYVLASATIDGKTWLLDATGKHQPMTYIPVKCLNGNGLLVSKANMRWVPLLGDEKQNTVCQADMKVSGEGGIKGTMKVSQSGYAGEEIRDDYARDGAEKYYKTMKEHHREWQVTDVSLEKTDSLNAPVIQHYTLGSEDMAQLNGNMIYFNNLLGFGQNSNPFKAEKRENLIDFIYPIKDVYVFTYEIPDGFTVQSMPDPARLMLADQAGSFKFTVTSGGNKIMVHSSVSITKTMFTAEEYASLREFFTRIVAKHAEQIVLKKI